MKEQILNIIKTKGFNPNKFKFVKLTNNLYKFCLNDSHVTYIEITQLSSPNVSQTMNWRPQKKNMLPYIKKLEDFAFDVVCIIEVVDSILILQKCVTSLKNQLSEPYILLIATNQEERQFAIQNDIDFIWSTDKRECNRLGFALNHVRSKLKEADNIMLCNSNTIVPANWISEAMKLMATKQYDAIGTSIQYIIDIDKKLAFKRQLNTTILNQQILEGTIYDGLIISKSCLVRLNWNIMTSEFRNDIELAIFSKLVY